MPDKTMTTWIVYIIGGPDNGVSIGEFSEENEARDFAEAYAYRTGWFGLEVRAIEN